MGLRFERSGDYYKVLTEYQQKRLQISREIGHRFIEGYALMFCGQITGLYLGDYEAGLTLLEGCLLRWQSFSSVVFPLLRIAQIQTEQGRYSEAMATLEQIHNMDEQKINDTGRAGLRLVTAILYLALDDEVHLRQVLELAAQTSQLAVDTLISQQYEMAAACKMAIAHLKLADHLDDETESRTHRRRALESSQKALAVYSSFGFTQIIECVSEEIFFYHGLALAVNDYQSEATEYLQRAYDEMMRKHSLIPQATPFLHTFLNIPLHREISAKLSLSIEHHTHGEM
jgi:tetratricopeptide (TPR) repeat protein